MAIFGESLSQDEHVALDAWLAKNEYRDLHEWAFDSDYKLTDEGQWTDEDDHPVDIASCAYFAMEAAEEYYSSHCRAEECDAPLDDGEGWDGLCGNCADKEALDMEDEG